MRPFAPGIYPQVLEARARRARSTRCSTRSSARRCGCSASGRRSSRSPRSPTFPPAPGLGSSGSFTTALLQGALRAPAAPAASARARRAGLRDRDRPPRRADRQAGPVHRGVRRRHLLHVPSATSSVDAEPLAMLDGHAVQPRGQPAAVLHRLLAQRRHRSSRTRRRAREQQRRGDARRTCTTSRTSACAAARRSSAGDTARLRRADARALGAQEAALRRHEQPADRRVVRARPRRTARSAASWSAPAAAASCCSTPRTTGGCARRWPGPASRKCASASTSRARRCCSREPAGRDPRRRPGHAAAARSPRRIPKALVEVAGRPFAEHQLELLRAAGRQRRRVAASGTSASRSQTALGDGARWGMRFDYVFDGPRAARHRRRAAPRAAAARRRVLRAVRRLVPRRATSRRSSAAFRASGEPALMTVFRNDGPLGSQQRACSTTARIVALRQDATATPDMRHIDYGLGVLPPVGASRRIRPDAPFDLAAVYQDLLAARPAGRLRGAGPVLRDRIARRARRHATRYLARERTHASMTYTRTASRRSRADHRSSSTPARSSAWSTLLADVRAARRPAVLPRRRRQRRQLLARGQRLPQDRRLRGLRADRQRLGADRAHQRRGLGDGLRRRGCKGSRLRREGRASSCSRSAAATSRRTSARTSSRALRVRQGGRRDDRRHRRPRRRLHGAGRRRLRDRADRESRDTSRRTPRRSRRWSGTCSCRIPALKARADQVGIDAVSRARGLPRPRRRAQSAPSSATASRIRRRRVDELEILPGVRRGAARGCKAAGYRARRRDQPAGRRARHARRATRSTRSTRGCARDAAARRVPRLLPRRRATTARAASRSPGCCSTRRAHATSISRAASWSAIAGATSRPGARAGCAHGPHRLRLRRTPIPTSPTCACASLRRGGRRGSCRGPPRATDRMTARRPAQSRSSPTAPTWTGMLALYRKPLHQGLHDQPDADAQGRHHRLPRPSPARCWPPSPIGRSRSRCSPTSSPRWSGRRARSPPGASNVYVKIPVTNTRGEPAVRR